MARIKYALLYISCISFLLFSDAKSTVVHEPLDDFDTSKAMVRFNPYISVLDTYNSSRYETAELIPLIEKIATRFNKISVAFHSFQLNDRAQTLLAVALYNCLPTTENKVEVFLDVVLDDVHDFRNLIALADKANLACNGTITSIIVQLSGTTCPNIEKYKMQLNSQFNYSLDIVLIRLAHQNVNHRLYSEFPKNLTCEPYKILQNWTHPVKLVIESIASDIGTNSIINMTRLVTYWRNVLTLPSEIYVISYAFDYFDWGSYTSEGWWYLLKDPGSTNTSQFEFVEKILVASELDFEESPKNFEWLETKHQFDEITTGIITLRDEIGYDTKFKQFCRLMFLNERISDNASLSNLILTDKWFSKRFLENCSSFSVYHLPILDKNGAMDLFTNNITSIHAYSVGDSPLARHGYAYKLDICGRYISSSKHFDIFANSELVAFYFYEKEQIDDIGSTKLVRQNKVLFENCRKLVQSRSNTTVEIIFVSLGYFKTEKFPVFPVALQNYVKYIYLLESWAKSHTNIVIFLGQYEDELLKIGNGLNFVEQIVVGWMSHYKREGTRVSKRKEALEISKLHYPNPIHKTVNITTKIVEYVNLTTEADETFALTGTSLFLVIGISLVVFVILIALVSFFVCRNSKNENLSNYELGIFLNGNAKSEDGAQKVPYDKEKYEISENDFKLKSEVPIGAGEFGAVYSGIIEQSSGKVEVAVKTSNPNKIHKTQLTGLLSEIKVLAHIGKHVNITELLGANTSSLKKGKVYIFLEFCHLGSLEKYLRDLRNSISSSPIQETNIDAAKYGNNYTNASASTQIILDDALSKDLYRWSTEICNGMSFLAEKHVVHADLATRNVLLNLQREAKICDFGLSRRMYNYTNYVKTQQEPLPWKWMAPESLRDMEFNEKTDVWAYGVTLWEIYSLASNPYAGLSWDVNFSQMLEQGLRLSEPEYCEGDMFEIMKKCWNICPENRPRFSELLLSLQNSDV